MPNTRSVQPTKLILASILLLSIFLTTFNLNLTQAFVGDVARDTLRMLSIWQQREITLLGPPLSLGLGSTHELYFSSVPLYFGLIGLIASGLDPVGAIYPGIFLYLLSIPLLYRLLTKLSTNPHVAIFGTSLYAFSPAIVSHTRFFWNPNPLLPLAVLFWLLFVQAKVSLARKSLLYFFLSGFVLGIMFDFHYLGILGGVLAMGWLLLSKEVTSLLLMSSGFAVGAMPIILFELRNHGFLISSLWYNLKEGGPILDLAAKVNPFIELARPWLSIIGFTHTEMSYPILFNLPVWTLTLVGAFIIFSQLFVGFRLQLANRQSRPFLLLLLLAFLLLGFAQVTTHTRYLWGLYPLLIWLLAESIMLLRSRLVPLAIIVFVLATSLHIITTPRTLEHDGVIPLHDLKLISQLISSDNPVGNYNLMDSVTGDARAISLRYYVQKDVTPPPLSITNYNNLSTLYVLAPSLDNITSGARWEFTATPNLKLVESWPVGPNFLFKFAKK